MKFLFFSSIIFFNFQVDSQKIIKIKPDIISYKKIDTISLDLYVYKPIDFDKNKKYKTIIFFHGGGWRNGNPTAFRRQAMYFASRGMIAITPEYRLSEKHGTNPMDCVEDAKDVINYISKFIFV